MAAVGNFAVAQHTNYTNLHSTAEENINKKRSLTLKVRARSCPAEENEWLIVKQPCMIFVAVDVCVLFPCTGVVGKAKNCNFNGNVHGDLL